MVLVDTSVWVDHLRRRNARLSTLLGDGLVLCHPFVIGELACGHLSSRDEILALLGALPEAPTASHHEVLRVVGSRQLYGQGIGWIDAHLLSSALLARVELWTRDKRLQTTARRLGIDSDSYA